MRILALADKDVGLRTVRFLLDRFPEDEYRFILGEGAADIATLLQDRGHSFERASPDALMAVEKSDTAYDWILNLWGANILSPAFLARGIHSLNIHPSLLPIGRGRDPVVWALRDSRPAGVSLHVLTPGVDEGPIWYQEEVPYDYPIAGGQLYRQVVERCWQVFCERWPEIRAGRIVPNPQGDGPPTKRRRDLLADRTVNLDVPEARRERDLVLKLLAHDFPPDYSARLILDGRIYDAVLSLKPVDDESGADRDNMTDVRQ